MGRWTQEVVSVIEVLLGRGADCDRCGGGGRGFVVAILVVIVARRIFCGDDDIPCFCVSIHERHETVVIVVRMTGGAD